MNDFNNQNGMPPIPQAPQPEQNGGIYNPQIESLINMALADGELTEKEKQILFKKAQAYGIDLDEFEMVLEAKLYEKQKSLQAEAIKTAPVAPASNAAPSSTKYGDIKKCPNCGAIIESFTTRCTDCGFEFSEVGTISSVRAFFKRMEEIEEQRNEDDAATSLKGKFLGMMMGNTSAFKSTTLKKKETLIQNFPIPTSKNDILEFLTMAVPSARPAKKWGMDYDEETFYLQKVWHRKCEQIIIKARLTMKDDKNVMSQIEAYAKELKIK